MGSLTNHHYVVEIRRRLQAASTVQEHGYVSDTVVGQNNLVLSFHQFVENRDWCMLFDSEALYDICIHALEKLTLAVEWSMRGA